MKLLHLLRFSFLLLALFLTLPALAGSIIVNKVTTGSGGLEQGAINNALKKAIIEVNGAEIKSVVISTIKNTGETSTDNNASESSTTFSFEKASTTELELNGFIDGYTILNSEEVQGMWKVEVEVRVYRFELDKSTSRKRIALLPVMNNYSSTIAGKKLANKLENAIESELVQTRKFAVLTRSHIDNVISELNFMNSGAVQKSDRAKLGNLLGSDVLLSVAIEKGYISTTETFIKITGQTKRETSGALKINVKVISSVTGEVKYSESYASNYGGRLNSLDAMVGDVAHKAITGVVSAIYPPLVINASDAGIVLNVGGKAIKNGATYKIFAKGEELRDPYTGESLGSVEREVGIIKVNRVEPKFSVGQVLTGSGFEAGMVARPTEMKPYSKSPASLKKQDNRSPHSDGGFKLPFDR